MPPAVDEDRGKPLRVVLMLAAATVIVAGLKHSAPVVVPLLLAFFLAASTMPVVHALTALRVPRAAAVVAALVLDVALLLGMGVVFADTCAELSRDLPSYRERIVEVHALLLTQAAAYGAAALVPPLPSAGDGELVERVTAWASTQVLGAGSGLAMVMLVLAFVLFEAGSMQRRLGAALGDARWCLPALLAALHDIQRYAALKALVSVMTGLTAMTVCWVAGVAYAPLWGLLAFVMHFVPFVGGLVAAVPPVLLAAVQVGAPSALAVAAGYVLINVVVGNVLEAKVFGRALSLSPLVVVIAMLFWGWVLGPAGALLAVPLVTSMKLLCDGRDELRWLAVLMADDAPPAPPVLEVARAVSQG